MQPRTFGPRSELTATQVQAIIEAESVEVDFGLELLDSDDNFVEDISTDMVDSSGSIQHGNYNNIHSTIELALTRELDWGSARVKPYMTMRAGGVLARFDLGVYLMHSPLTVAGDDPRTYDVQGYDKLYVLDTPLGESYSIASGADVLAAVRALIEATGETAITIVGEGDPVLMPSARVYELDERTTTLSVVNDLLGLIGYRALWVDWTGTYRAEPYTSPADRGSEWTYTADDERTTIVHEDRVNETDLHEIPNAWVFIRDDPEQGAPATDDGIYAVENQSDGPASIDARGGLVRRRIMRVDSANQFALEVRGNAIVDRDKNVTTKMRVDTGPNPLHWHFDVITLIEDGVARKFIANGWELPLDGTSMSHEWRLIL